MSARGLSHVFLAVRSLAPYATVATGLGFRPAPAATVTLDAANYHSAILAFGPGSVDGWIARLVAAEIGIERGEILDACARELVLPTGRVHLTPMKFGVFERLSREPGRAVPRDTLLADVWGYEYDGGSNVVDVVVRSLREKMGPAARLIETERGVGYRYRPASRPGDPCPDETR